MGQKAPPYPLTPVPPVRGGPGELVLWGLRPHTPRRTIC